ncbi:sel1 repeat family protein [Pelomyxa schiedti]|nr:sel1 repeat family protein [Pelomyxa schiedti]
MANTLMNSTLPHQALPENSAEEPQDSLNESGEWNAENDGDSNGQATPDKNGSQNISNNQTPLQTHSPSRSRSHSRSRSASRNSNRSVNGSDEEATHTRDENEEDESQEESAALSLSLTEEELSSLFQRGMCLLHGVGTDRDLPQAFSCFLDAAQCDYAPAKNMVGRMVLFSIGTRDDPNTAVIWFREAAEQGDTDATNAMGLIFELGACNVKPDMSTAAQYYQVAAKKGNHEAMTNLAYFYEKGLGVPRNFKAAYNWYLQAAQLGNPRAMNNLGTMYLQGRGITVMEDEAFHWFLQAAIQNHTIAIIHLGFMYEVGCFVDENLDMACDLYSKAASLGDTNGNLQLGRLKIKTGEQREGIDVLNKACLNGNYEAHLILGELYQSGWPGTQPNLEIARSHFLEAAQNNIPKGLVRLGVLCYTSGLENEIPLAFSCFSRAATIGDPEAQVILGELYRDGIGTEPSQAEAEKWFSLAAGQGEPWGMYNLGQMYENTICPDPQQHADLLKKAWLWYRRASDAGHQPSQDKLQMWPHPPVWFLPSSTTTTPLSGTAKISGEALWPNTNKTPTSSRSSAGEL